MKRRVLPLLTAVLLLLPSCGTQAGPDLTSLDQAAAEAEEAEEPESEEDPVPEGTLVDPQTGETVQMPDPSTVDPEDPSMGDVPINDNLLDVKPAEVTDPGEEDDPTE